MIKEYCESNKTVVIRDNRYGSSLGKFLFMYEEAKKDFPWLTPEDITLIKYGGERYAKTWGIEFEVIESVPDEYERISQLETI